MAEHVAVGTIVFGGQTELLARVPQLLQRVPQDLFDGWKRLAIGRVQLDREILDRVGEPAERRERHRVLGRGFPPSRHMYTPC